MFKEESGGVTFSIILQPRSSFIHFSGVQEGFIKLRVNAPPVENKANIECVKYLSQVFNVSKTKVSIVQGKKSRRKKIRIEGLTSARAQQIIEEHLI